MAIKYNLIIVIKSFLVTERSIIISENMYTNIVLKFIFLIFNENYKLARIVFIQINNNNVKNKVFL